MKIHFIKSPLILVLILSIVATGCLKDKAFDNGTIQSGSGGSGADVKVITLGITVSDTTNFLQAAYPLIPDNDTTVNLVPVELGGLSDASQDIHVTLVENSTLVDDYNTNNGTAYTDPGANITIVSNIVTIPKGSRTGYLQIKFKPSNLLNGTFAYGFTISSIAEAGYTIGNLRNGIVAIGPKNQWDGIYKSSGVFTHPAYGVLTWDFSKGITQELVTAGLTDLTMYPTNTSIGGFGAELDITVNPDNTIDEVFNGNPTPKPNDDHYDPATLTFYVSGSYQGASGPRTYKATLTYKGPR
jgi:hypothetical protein